MSSRSGRFASILTAFALIGAIGNAACRAPSKVQAVAIVSMPKPERAEVDCDIPELPEAPEDPPWPEARYSGSMDRAWAHRRDLENVLKFTRDLEHAFRSLAVCVENMRGAR